MEVYAAQVDRVDQGVGRILDALEKTGRFDNTLIFVSSDNGGCAVEYTPNRTGNFLNEATRDGRPLKVGNVPGIMPGPEDTWQSYGRNWAFLSNTPLRRGKGEEYEGGNRVPMIVHWPGMIRNQGGIVHDTAHFIDVLPTVLDAAGIPYPNQFKGRVVSPPDGNSLIPIFRGKPWGSHEYLYWEFAEKKAVRSGKWKLVYPRGGPWELYDVESDSIESQNRAVDYPEIVERLSQKWDEWYSIVPAKK
jgi:arylsulfatase